MTPTDLLPLELWIEFENDINRLYGLDANVFNTDGIRISDVKNWANRICPKIKSIDKGQSFICAVAHMNVATIAARQNQAVIEECDAGLLKLVVPIMLDDTYIGAVGACGMLLDDGEIDSFLINKITEIPEEETESLASDLRSISTERVNELIAFIQDRLAQIIHDHRNP